MTPLRSLPLLTAILMAVTAVCAQQPPPAATPAVPAEPVELGNLRQAYITKALTAGRTLTDQFLVALSGLEHNLGAAGDYEQALLVQKRRLELAETYKTVMGDAATTNTIILKPIDARLVGAITYDKSGVLEGWKTSGSTATWDVPRIIPGMYDVTITYAAESATGVVTGNDYDFFEDSSLAGAAANARSFQLPTTASITTYATVSLAPLSLQRTNARFTLRAARVRGAGSLMNLKEIRITPAKAVAETNAAGTPAINLETLRQNYIAKIKATAKPLVDNYVVALKKLGADLTAKQDADAAAAAETESSRVTSWLANPVPLANQTAAPAPIAFKGSFEVMEDARFVPRPTNTGDKFLVTHEGKEVLVRLLWVNCPPITRDNPTALKRDAEYFGITEDDALAIGKEAADFTNAYLSDKPLRILSRGGKDKDGALLAIVVAPNIGDIASILVDNGLAAVAKPTAKGTDLRRREEQNLQALKDRETAARSRPIPPGAWALAPEIPKP